MIKCFAKVSYSGDSKVFDTSFAMLNILQFFMMTRNEYERFKKFRNGCICETSGEACIIIFKTCYQIFTISYCANGKFIYDEEFFF